MGLEYGCTAVSSVTQQCFFPVAFLKDQFKIWLVCSARRAAHDKRRSRGTTPTLLILIGCTIQSTFPCSKRLLNFINTTLKKLLPPCTTEASHFLSRPTLIFTPSGKKVTHTPRSKTIWGLSPSRGLLRL